MTVTKSNPGSKKPPEPPPGNGWLVVGRDNFSNDYYPITLRKEKSEAEVIRTLRMGTNSPIADTYYVMSPAEAVERVKLPWNMIELLIQATSDEP